ncbi:MAG: response regulator transcription factor [Xanthomonadales bacterium]|nr:response regulator transcription factor [Xanthomonadales bacterium]
MRLLVVDDEPLARERLRYLVDDIGGHEVVGEATNGRDAVERADELKPDAVLLDISMPVMSGLEAARLINELEAPPAVVFCTACDEHALAAFDARAVDYLVKPIRAERLGQALDRARRLQGEQVERLRSDMGEDSLPRTHLCARLRGNLRLIPVQDIHYLQAEEKYTIVHHARGEDLIDESLKSLEQEFGERFLRIHRNCLIAAGELLELRRDGDGHTRALLRSVDAELEVSRRSLPGLRQRVRGQ